MDHRERPEPFQQILERDQQHRQAVERRQAEFAESMNRYVSLELETVDLEELQLQRELTTPASERRDQSSDDDAIALELLDHLVSRSDEQRARVGSMLAQHMRKPHVTSPHPSRHGEDTADRASLLQEDQTHE